MSTTLSAPDSAIAAEHGVGSPRAPLPERRRYRLKKRLLGPPLHTEQLEHERLGKPTALAVFASDNLSSSAYATEEILRVLVPAVGVAAFALVVPITIAMLAVLALLILSYRQTIKAYPTAGGAYVVTKDNFGLVPAQIAGLALLIDYVLTVAVSVAAGTAALTSAFGALTRFTVPIAIGFVVLIAFGNLRGVRESGKLFALPTYFFIANVGMLLLLGLWRGVTGGLPTASTQPGMLSMGAAGDGLLLGASAFIVLHAFASGGAAVTGVEAISNGVPAFRAPDWKNARTTLVIMGTLLGTMFAGLSVLAAHMHVVPYEDGTPTVIAQIGQLVYGDSPAGHAAFYLLQAGTMLILVLAANTSFADFPRLASFQAGDNFMPRQLTKRGHRLVFSNGIIALAASAIFLVIVTDAQVDRLIPLYAVGVFTSFTLSQAGMAKRHLRLRQPGWQRGLAINGIGAVISLVVALVIAVTKFTHGAWVVVVLVPALVFVVLRLNREYETDDEELERGAVHATEAPILDRHVVVILVGKLDLSTARAVQYARTLLPDELMAVHFVLDDQRADELADKWQELGLSGVSLYLVDCPDRRITRAALELVAEKLSDGGTEVSVLIPRLEYRRRWHRILHDRTSDELAKSLADLPHANVTFVPYHLGVTTTPPDLETAGCPASPVEEPPDARTPGPVATVDGVTPIAAARSRQRVKIRGRVRSLRVQPQTSSLALEIVVADETGSLVVTFLGRRRIAGIETGVLVDFEGTILERGGARTMLNPAYTLLSAAERAPVVPG
jgi:amino acid transporter